MLVPDWKTHAVTLVLPTAEMYVYNDHLAELELFYADFLRELTRFNRVDCVVPGEADVEKMVRLSGVPEENFRTAAIPDIWIRDFAPLPTRDGFLKFVYNPPYTRKKFNRELDAAFRSYLADLELPVVESSIVLDGGNLVHDGRGTGIVTNKVFALNREQPKERLLRALRETLGLERLAVVPAEPEDKTGHVDGMMHWLDSKRLLVNDYRAVGQVGFEARLARVLDRELPEVERIRLPYAYFPEKLGGWWDVRGNYANLLVTRERVYLPQYGIETDDEAREILERELPGRVSAVRAEAIARYGGSLHCVTWNHP